MALLEVENLKVHYFTREGVIKAVDDVSFSVDKGEALGLIGESGCGKTTVASALMRFVKPPGRVLGGKIIFNGRDIITMNDEELRLLRGEMISISLQSAQNALNPIMPIGGQISEKILEHECVTKEEAWENAKKQLELVGLNGDNIKRYPHQFSGGMKQAAMIAIAAACNPKFLIVDELVTGLDVIIQRQLLTLINNLRGKWRPSMIFITHDLAVIAETCDNVAVMYAGKLVELASAVSLYENPMHPYSQALIQAYPSTRGEKKQLRSIPGAPPSLINPPTGCRFYPRCSHAMDVCQEMEPALKEADGHSVACHLMQE